MEYEYSFKVKNLEEYLKIIKEKYDFIESYDEKRVIYRKDDTIGRITYINNDMYLDFKENKLSNEDLIVRKESEKIKFDNLDNCESILSFLGYKKDNTLERTRTIYKGNKVKFEIDEYRQPEVCNVLSFEGDKTICDAIYKDFEGLNKKYKI